MVAIADALHRRLDDVLVDLARSASRNRPPGLPGNPVLEAEVRSTLRTTTETAIALIAGDRRLTTEEIAMLRAIGARRARRGVPLASLKAAVQVAMATMWDRAVDAAVALPVSATSTAALGRIGTLLAHLSETVTAALDDGYSEGAQRSDDEERARAQLLADVLAGGVASQGALAEMRLVHTEATLEHGLVLVAAPAPRDGRACIRSATAELLSDLQGATEVPLTSAATSHVTVAVPVESGHWPECVRVADAVARREGVLIFTAPPVAAMELSAAYGRATRLLCVAQNLGLPPQALEARHVRLASLLAETSGERRAFIEETLGPVLALPANLREPLLATIRVLNDIHLRGGIRAAAETLQVHLKTVYYRLNRLRELTGLDHDVAAERMQLALAVELMRFPDVEAVHGEVRAGAEIKGLPLHRLARAG